MNKELEEAIKRLKILECDCIYFENGKCTYDKNKCQREQDIETALNYIDNSISKEVIEEKKEELEKQREKSNRRESNGNRYSINRRNKIFKRITGGKIICVNIVKIKKR